MPNLANAMEHDSRLCGVQYLRSLGWCVEAGMKLKELHRLVAPALEGDDEFELGNGNAAYVEASSC